ncbi:MAG TPA: hypothetical protein VGI40_01700 [Pirellulaceae bacterium]
MFEAYTGHVIFRGEAFDSKVFIEIKIQRSNLYHGDATSILASVIEEIANLNLEALGPESYVFDRLEYWHASGKKQDWDPVLKRWIFEQDGENDRS